MRGINVEYQTIYIFPQSKCSFGERNEVISKYTLDNGILKSFLVLLLKKGQEHNVRIDDDVVLTSFQREKNGKS